MSTASPAPRWYGAPLLLLMACGCTAVQPLPDTIQTGGTLIVALGGTATDGMLRRQQVSVSVADAAGTVYPVSLRNLLRLYGDPTSSYALRSGGRWRGGAVPLEAYAAPYEGQWLAVVDLVDPATRQPPALAAGGGSLRVASPARTHSVPVNVLPGIATPNPLDGSGRLFGYAPLDTLEPMPQVLVAPRGAPSRTVGGAAFVFQYTTAEFQDTHKAPRAVIVSPDPNLTLLSARRDLGGGVTELAVALLDPYGFKSDDQTDGDFQNGMALWRDLKLALVWDKSLDGITDANWRDSLRLVRATYYDLDGAPLPELVPELRKVR